MTTQIDSTRSIIFAEMQRRAVNGLAPFPARSVAARIGVSDTTVTSAIAWFRSRGWIKCVEDANAHHPAIYHLVPEADRRPKSGRIAGMASEAWPEERLERLVGLWRDGLSTSEIGVQMGTTKNAIVGKAHRLIDAGILEPRASPIIRSSEPREPRPAPAPRATLPPLPSARAITLPIKSASEPKFKGNPRSMFGLRVSERPAVIEFRAPVEPSPRPRLVADEVYAFGPSQEPCQWIVKEGSVIEPWVHCGMTRAAWPYCTGHMKRAYGKDAA